MKEGGKVTPTEVDLRYNGYTVAVSSMVVINSFVFSPLGRENCDLTISYKVDNTVTTDTYPLQLTFNQTEQGRYVANSTTSTMEIIRRELLNIVVNGEGYVELNFSDNYTRRYNIDVVKL